MAQIRLEQAAAFDSPELHTAPENGAVFSLENGKVSTPVNEYGLVVPPEYTACPGGCKFSGEGGQCPHTRHHLHSTEAEYWVAGETAEKFRDLPILTVWLPKCRHEEHHQLHEVHVPIPSLEVMRQAIDEARKLQDVVRKYREIAGTDNVLTRPETTLRQKKGLKRHQHRLFIEKKAMIKEVHSIEIIPEELITGALLLAAPNVARKRIRRGSDYTMSGTMLKSEVPKALSFANAAIEDSAATTITGVTSEVTNMPAIAVAQAA